MNCISCDICVYHLWFILFFPLGCFFLSSRSTGACPVTTDLIMPINMRTTIEVDDIKPWFGITLALVFDIKGEGCVLPADIVQAVDDFKVPDGYGREGSRERSFMYSLGVYVVPLAEEDHKHKYFCMADPACRKNKTAVP